MKVTRIPFHKTGFFSKTMIDYLDEKATIQPFYHHFPNIAGYAKQIREKALSFPPSSRTVLVEALKKQYKEVEASEITLGNIELLQNNTTFTITTGHQLNLFTGPLYFLYKIISTINLCEQLREEFPENQFVPVYWMASEDHDFEEINYFNFQGKKLRWDRTAGGPVGRFSTDRLDKVLQVFSEQLGTSSNAIFLKELFKKGYLEHTNLAAATRYIADALFSEFGLVIIDADDAGLKELFSPYVKQELLHQTSYKAVSATIANFEQHYKVQVNPREINLFYMKDGLRSRIINEGGQYIVNDTSIRFSEEEVLKELQQHPECFSPNVIMRPLYQEVILPNLCYIGGGGELAYWLELKNYFEEVGIPFPILLLRNSVQIISAKQQKKLNALDISYEDLFLKQNELLTKKVVENSMIHVDFEHKKSVLQQNFDELRAIAKETDASFIGAVNAQERKQINGLENLERRLLRAEKKRQKDLVKRITAIQDQLLPNKSLEERQLNFSEYYLEYGPHFIKALKASLHPLQLDFTILEL